MPARKIFQLLCLAVLAVDCGLASVGEVGDSGSFAHGAAASMDGSHQTSGTRVGRRLHQGTSSCETSTLDGYECMVTPGGLEGMTIHYLVGPVAGDATVPALSEDQIWFAVQAVTTGWVGIGFTEAPGRMSPSDCVVGWMDGGTPVVKAYRVPMRFIDPSNEDLSIEIGDVSASEEEGITTIAFTWNLASGTVPVDLSSGAIEMIAAFGASDALVQHARDERTPFSLNFLSGGTDGETQPTADEGIDGDTGAGAAGDAPVDADADAMEADFGSCPLSNLPGYRCAITVPGVDGLRVHYTAGPVDGNGEAPALSADQISFAVEGVTSGWVGIAFAENSGSMAPADCVVGWVEDGVATVTPYRVTSRNISPGDEDASIEITDLSGSEVDGITTIEFTWNVASGNVPVDLSSGFALMNGALGGSDGLVQHAVDERASFTLSGVSLNDDLSRYYKAHGVLMIAAWMFLIPTGLLCARHKWASARFGRKGLWFQIHRGVQTVGVLLALAALGIAVNKFECCKTEDGDHHRPLGITVIVMALQNATLGLLRPGTESRRRWMFNYVHYFLGYGSFALSIATVFLGISAYDDLTTNDVSSWIAATVVGLALFVGAHMLFAAIWSVTGRKGVEDGSHPSKAQLNMTRMSHLPGKNGRTSDDS